MPAPTSSASTAAAASALCDSCCTNAGKYRCAHCRSFRYCSVACYQTHKSGTSCVIAEAAKAAAQPAASGNAATATAAPAAATVNAAAPSPTAPAAAATPAAALTPAPAAEPKSSQPTVSADDLATLARDPHILNALSSAELRTLLRTIDSGGASAGSDGSSSSGGGGREHDQRRLELLENQRRNNPDFEAFIQRVLTCINGETAAAMDER